MPRFVDGIEWSDWGETRGVVCRELIDGFTAAGDTLGIPTPGMGLCMADGLIRGELAMPLPMAGAPPMGEVMGPPAAPRKLGGMGWEDMSPAAAIMPIRWC